MGSVKWHAMRMHELGRCADLDGPCFECEADHNADPEPAVRDLYGGYASHAEQVECENYRARHDAALELLKHDALQLLAHDSPVLYERLVRAMLDVESEARMIAHDTPNHESAQDALPF